MSEEKKIKTFNHYNDEMINEFLKQTKGKIVNYNPIVIEYNSNINFVDPYRGYESYKYNCIIQHTPLSNIDKEKHEMINEALFKKKNVDTVMFNKSDGKIKFMYKGKLCFDTASGDYCCVSLQLVQTNLNFGSPHLPIDTLNFHGENKSSVDYNFPFYADTAWGDLFDFESYLIALKCERINFN